MKMNCPMIFRMHNISLKKIAALWIAVFLFCCTALVAGVPKRPNPPRLVNDFAHIFSTTQVNDMEQRLVEVSDSTSNQICVVTLSDLEGEDIASLAAEIGEKWGVGNKKFDNGVVILVKPKNDTRGECFIATGYGLEGVLPDAVCKLIVERKMIPAFKQNDYYAGVNAALDDIIPIVTGEYSYKEITGDDDWSAAIVVVAFIVLVIVLLALGKGNSNNYGSGGKKSDSISSALAAAALLSIMGRSSGRSSGGGFSHGGGFGGFGGFGGGSFGGGGAGGSW